jgi:hypothetical protein
VITPRTQSIASALARVHRQGSLQNDIHAEAAVLVKKVRPLLSGFRLGSVVRALFTLTAEYAGQLLKIEEEGCDCIHDVAHGLFRCDSPRHHAVVIPLIEEERKHATQR